MKKILILSVICFSNYLLSVDRCSIRRFHNEQEARKSCPIVCLRHGGWNGNWMGKSIRICDGTGVCGCNN